MDTQTARSPFPVEIGGVQNLVAFSGMDQVNWRIAAVIPYKFLYSESDSLRTLILIIGVICLAAVLVLSYAITASISSPLKKLVGLMNVAKAGDLSFNVEDRSKDELAEVLTSFNDMLQNISSLISKVSISASEVLKNSSQISTLAGQTHSNSEQVAWTIEEIARGSIQQAEDIDERLWI